jgi:hypothetical protein
MSKRDLKRKKTSGGTLMGFTMMEVGIILILVAQSFADRYRLFVFGGGILLLLCGLVLFVCLMVKERFR